MITLRRSLLAACLAALTVCSANAARAECTTLYYSVNDYGKDGPARDAQDLLDKYIVKWAAGKGIKKYTAGKKDVQCKLFLDFIAFDEYTCAASSKVCW